MSQLILRVYNPKRSKFTDVEPGYYDLDIDQNTSQVKATLSTVENQNLGQVFGLGTQNFTLPATKNNDAFFEYSGDIGSVTTEFVFKKVYDAELLIDGSRVSRGKLYYNGTNTNEAGARFYKVNYTDTIPSLADIFGELRMADLPWFGAGYDHAFTWNNITGSWLNQGDFPLNGAVKYPNAFYGYQDAETHAYTLGGSSNSIYNNGKLLTKDFKPAVRLTDIIDLIFTGSILNRDGETNYENNLSVSSSFLDGNFTFGNSNTDSDALYILAPGSDGNKGPTDPVPQYVLLTPSSSYGQYTTIGTLTSVPPGSGCSFNSPPSMELNTDTSNAWDGCKFTAPAPGIYNFNLLLDLTNIEAPGDGDKTLRIIYRDANTGDNLVINDQTVFSGNTSQIVDGLSTALELANEQEIIITISLLIAQQSYDFDLKTTLEIVNTNPVPDVVFMDYQWGDLKVIDFLKGLQQMFNLVFWTDYDEPNVIKIEPYNVWLDQGVERDWSDKVDHSKGIQVTHPSQEQPKEVTFQYAEGEGSDHDYVRRVNKGVQRGTYTFISDSDYNLGSEETLENPVFVPTTMNPIDGATSNDVSKNMTIPIIRQLEDGKDKPYEFKPRILFNNGIEFVTDDQGDFKYYNILDVVVDEEYQEYRYLQMSPVTSMRYINSAGDAIPFASLEYMPAASYYWNSDRIIQYQHQASNDGLYNLFYARQFNNLYRNAARKVTMNLVFSPQDITEFQLNDLIFIDGQKYRINKISGFDFLKESSCQVELIRELQPFNAPVFTIGNNGGPGSPGNPGGTDGTVVVGIGDEFTFEGDVSGNTFEVQPTYVTGENSGSLVSGSLVKGYQATQLGITIGSGSKFFSKLNQPAGAFTDKILGGNVDQNDNTLPSDNANTVTALGSRNRVEFNSTNTQVIGDDNTIGINTNDLFVIGDNNVIGSDTANSMVVGSDLESSGSIENSVIVGSNTFIAEGASVSDSLIAGEAAQIKTTFQGGTVLGRSSEITGSGTNAFSNCNIIGAGVFNKDNWVGSAGIPTAVNFLAVSRPTVFDNPVEATIYNGSNVMGQTFHLESIHWGYKNGTAIGTGNSYFFSSHEIVLLVGGSGGGAGTITLPDADDYPGRIITIKSKVASSAGTATISVSGGGNIDGSATYTFNSTDYECIQVISDDSDWWIISKV